VIDFGPVSGLRSQTLWHAIAHGVSNDGSPTLSFMQPTEAYVSIGYHRRLDEVDQAFCRARSLPVYRRMVGGGPVLIDDGQLFFQITVPTRDLPPSRAAALRRALEPAVAAFRAVGIPATLDERLEIVVGDRKVCGYGAGQLGDAVVVVGNLITRFDHDLAARVMSTPHPQAASELARMVRRYVAAHPADRHRFCSAATAAYADRLGLEPTAGALTTDEQRRLADLDEQFVDPEWVEGPDRPVPSTWRVKVRAGIWVGAAGDGPTRATVSCDRQRVLRAHLTDPSLNGDARRVDRALEGRDLSGAQGVLTERGPSGAGLAALFAELEGVTV
jgi:lipoate-protein ligase A